MHRAVLTWPSAWHQQSLFKPSPKGSPDPWVNSSKPAGMQGTQTPCWPAHSQLFLVKDLISNCQGWVQPFSPAFRYVTCPSPDVLLRAALLGAEPSPPRPCPQGCAQRLNPLLHPPQLLHFPKSSNSASITKRSDAVLYYLSAPAQGSKVPAEQARAALPNWRFGREALCSAVGGG